MAEVQEHMAVSDAAVYQWETGVTRPNASKLPRLAEYYGCTIEELLAPDEEQKDE